MTHTVIVDDHILVAEALSYALASSGEVDEVDVAGSVAEVRAYCRARRNGPGRPDVALVEYYLGDGAGLTAAALLKLYCPDIRVVMMSSQSSPGQVGSALAAGCAGFIRKTNAVADLLRLIRPAPDGAAPVAATDSRRELLDEALPLPSEIALSQREQQTLGLLAAGLSTKAIAGRMTVAENTVCNHIRNLTVKLGAHTRLEAVSIAARSGLLAPATSGGG